MKAITLSLFAAALAFLMAGCQIADPLIVAVGLPLEVSANLNGGSAWNESDTFVIEDEITKVDVSYVDKVQASRVNDITISMDNPPASGTSSGTLSYALDGGSPVVLATWTNVPFPSLAGDGVSVLDAAVLTVNPAARTALLTALQDTSGLPLASAVFIQTSGTTSVAVPAGTKIVAKLHYQVDIKL
jgi:hypothetical protein